MQFSPLPPSLFLSPLPAFCLVRIRLKDSPHSYANSATSLCDFMQEKSLGTTCWNCNFNLLNTFNYPWSFTWHTVFLFQMNRKGNIKSFAYIKKINLDKVIQWSSHQTLIYWPDPLQVPHVDVNGGIVTWLIMYFWLEMKEILKLITHYKNNRQMKLSNMSPFRMIYQLTIFSVDLQSTYSPYATTSWTNFCLGIKWIATPICIMR